MKALVGAFNQEKALVGAFSVIVKPMEHYTALLVTSGRGEEQQADGRDCPRTNIWGIHLGRAAALSQFLVLAGVCDLHGVKVLVGAKSVPVPVMVN